MSKITMSGKGNIEEITKILTDEIQGSATSCELIESVYRNLGDYKTALLVFEKYYMRNSSRASLTVSIMGDSESVVVDAIGSGGGQGAIFNFSWGAEDDFVGTVENILASLGFNWTKFGWIKFGWIRFCQNDNRRNI